MANLILIRQTVPRWVVVEQHQGILLARFGLAQHVMVFYQTGYHRTPLDKRIQKLKTNHT